MRLLSHKQNHEWTMHLLLVGCEDAPGIPVAVGVGLCLCLLQPCITLPPDQGWDRG